MSETPSNNNVQTLRALSAIVVFIGMIVTILSIFWMGNKLRQAAKHTAALQTDLTTCRIQVADKNNELAAKDDETLAQTMFAQRLRMQLREMEETTQGTLNKDQPLAP